MRSMRGFLGVLLAALLLLSLGGAGLERYLDTGGDNVIVTPPGY